VSLKRRMFLNTLSLRMETEGVSETSEVFKQLTRLSAREEFVQLYTLL
jgi:hypothetical protein